MPRKEMRSLHQTETDRFAWFAWLEVTPWVLPALIAAVALFVYANSFPGTFILDDFDIVANNALVNSPDLAAIFSSDYWHPLERSGLFRPLTILSLAVNRLLLGAAPWGFHLVNVLLHSLVSLMLYLSLRAWGGGMLAASCAALLFAIHPVHTEVVNIVVGRSELLVALFLLSGFIAARSAGRWANCMVVICYLAALLAKEHAIMFVVLLPLWDQFSRSSKMDFPLRYRLYAKLAAITVVWLLWREFGVISDIPKFQLTEAAAPLAYVDDMTRLLTALQNQWLYLGKLLWPVQSQAVYSVADMPDFIRTPLSRSGALVLTGTLFALLLLVRGWRRHSPLALFGLFYLVAFLPTSNLLFPIGVSMAERLAYFPSVWFCAGIGTLAATLFSAKSLRHWCRPLLVGYLVFLCVLTAQRNPDFSNGVRLWRAEVAENPDDFLGWQNLAGSLVNVGQVEEADAAFRKMLALAPDYPGGLRTRTDFFLMQNLYAEALPSAHKVFAISQANNDYWGTAFDALDLADINIGLGHCGKALTLIDGPAAPLEVLSEYLEVRGMALTCLGRDAESIEVMARVEREDMPNRLRYLYGLSLFRLGRFADARMQLEQVVFAKGDAEAWNLLGVVYTQLGDRSAALASFAAALEQQPGNKHYQGNLERAQREVGVGR